MREREREKKIKEISNYLVCGKVMLEEEGEGEREVRREERRERKTGKGG